ncbi:hypothetical protein ACLOJK_026831, partial [Asimina triloba]
TPCKVLRRSTEHQYGDPSSSSPIQQPPAASSSPATSGDLDDRQHQRDVTASPHRRVVARQRRPSSPVAPASITAPIVELLRSPTPDSTPKAPDVSRSAQSSL